MEIDRVIKIVDELNDLSDKFSDDELRIATYLLIRYGTTTCKYYIDDSDVRIDIWTHFMRECIIN